MSDFNDIREYLKSIELSHLKLIASRINKDDTIKTSQPRSKIEKAISMRYLQNNNNSYAITKKDIRLLDSVKGRIIPKAEEQTTLSTVSAEPAEPATETLATEPRRKAGRPPGGTNPNAGRPKGSKNIRGEGEKWDKFKKYAIPIGATALALGAAYAGHKHYKGKQYQPSLNEKPLAMPHRYPNDIPDPDDIFSRDIVQPYIKMIPSTLEQRNALREAEAIAKEAEALEQWNSTIRDERFRGRGKGKKKVSMKLDELLSEHKRIVSQLAKIPSLKKEYNIQKREMKKYEIMKGNGIIGDFFKDQVKQQIDRYSLPFDVMRAVPFGTTIASSYVPYVEPASMLQGAIFGDRTSKRLEEIQGDENEDNEIQGNGEKWDKFKKYAIPIGATALALGALYAGHKHYKGQHHPSASVFIPSTTTSSSPSSLLREEIPTDPQERFKFMNLKKDEFLANRELEYRANRRMQEQADARAQASAQAEQAVKAEAKKAYDSAVLRASHSIPVSNAADAGDRLRAQNTAPIPKSGEPQIQELPEQLGVAPPRSRGRPKGIPNPKGGRPKGSLNKSKKNDDDMSGNGIIGDFFKDQLNQQIDRYSLPYDVMREIPFGTTIASSYVPYVGPASMLQGAIFGDRTSKRLKRIEGFEGLGKLGKDGHGQRVILHGKEKEIKQTIQHLHNILSKTK